MTYSIILSELHQVRVYRIGTVIVLTICIMCVAACKSGVRNNRSADDNKFRVVGYYVPMHRGGSMSVASIPYKYLTNINYSSAIPLEDGSGNIILRNADLAPDTIRALVRQAHDNDVEVFIYVGGFDIGDGPGIDTRFETLANSDKTRTTFTQACMSLVKEFDLDGIDIDWEFPDPVEPSLSNFVSLMSELADSLHNAGKKLSAAVESHRLPYTYGIDDRVFKVADWLNIMVYDGEEIGWHRPNLVTSHAPYWLAAESLKYWIDKRGLSKNKAMLGLPFYGKGANRRSASYRKLLSLGADPFSDVYDSLYYNGIRTVKRKVELAWEKAGGIMIWQIAGDTSGQFSLLKAINDAVGQQ